MTRPQTTPAYLNMISICVLGLWISLMAGVSGVQPDVAAAESPQTFLSQPNSDIELAIDLAGFTIDRDHVKPDGRRYVTAFHPVTGLTVSMTLEKAPGASTRGCVMRLQRLQKGPLISRGKDVALTTARDVQTLEYTLHRFQGLRLDQKSMYACMAEQNVYAGIHLSKVQYSAVDASLFHTLLETMRLQPSRSQQVAAPAPSTPARMPRFKIENVRYQHDDYVQAIAP